jgi:hypothetical protein
MARQAMMAIPRPDAMTPAWLSAVLGDAGLAVDIRSVAVAQVGAGQIGDTVRITPAYGARRGPATLIGKFAALDPGSRHVARNWGLYAREVGFYARLAATAGIATPRCHGAVMGQDDDFVLLLEDCAPARPGDQIAGIAPADAHRAMREAARLHAAFWARGDDPALAWLDTGPLAQPFYDAAILRGTWPGFRDRYAGRLTDAMVTVCDRLAERYEDYSRPLNRPRCVTHNDFRPDNMLFGENGALHVVDWQSAALGYNAVDVAYLIGGAFAPEDRRAIEGELLAAYHAELCDRGVSDFTPADLAEDYRHFAFAGINVAVGAAMMVRQTERGDRMFLTMLDRHVAHVLDTGALGILDGNG